MLLALKDLRTNIILWYYRGLYRWVLNKRIAKEKAHGKTHRNINKVGNG